MLAFQEKANKSEDLLVNGALTPGWRVTGVALLGLAFGPGVLLLLCFGMFVPALRAEFGWTIGEVTFGAVIISLSIAVLAPLQGALVDRFGSRRVILASLCPFALGLGAMALLNADIVVFYCACAALSTLAIGIWPPSYMKIVSTWFDRRLGLALGVAGSGGGLGGFVIPLILGAVLSAYGWRAGYLTLSAIILCVIFPLAYFAIRERAYPQRVGSETVHSGQSFAEIVRDRRFWLLLLSFVALGSWSNSISVNFVSIVTDRGIAFGQVVLLQSLVGACSLIGRIGAGWLLDRFHVAPVMLVFLAAAGLACFALSFTSAVPVVVLTAICCGLLIGAEFDALGFAIRRYHGMRAFGTVYGVIFAMFQIGGAAGAWIVGSLRDGSGSYSSGLLVLASCCMAGAAPLLLLGRYRFERPEVTQITSPR